MTSAHRSPANPWDNQRQGRDGEGKSIVPPRSPKLTNHWEELEGVSRASSREEQRRVLVVVGDQEIAVLAVAVPVAHMYAGQEAVRYDDEPLIS